MAPLESEAIHPEAREDAAPTPTTLHQHMTAGYEDRKALKAEAGFSPDTMITPKDLLGAEFARIDAAFKRAAPNAKPFAGFYRRGNV